MKHISVYARLFTITVVSFYFISNISAEPVGPGKGVYSKGLYSVDTVKTISGTVTEITANPNAMSKKAFLV